MRNSLRAPECYLSFWASPAFLCIAFGVIAFQFLAYLLAYPSHDWDIDAFLYLGSRLDQGFLLYTKDFETKLPFVQYLFWIPYKLGGVGSWRILTFLISTIFVIVSSKIITHSLKIYCKNSFYACVLIYLLLIFSLPGGESSHISIIASVCIYFAIASILYDGQRYNRAKFFASGVMISIAASIRPNYVFVLPAFILLVFANEYNLKSIITGFFQLFFGFCIIVICQCVPYLFNVDDLSSLVDGVNALKNFSNGIDCAQLFKQQFVVNKNYYNAIQDGRFYIILYASFIYIIVKLVNDWKCNRKLNKFDRIMLFCLMSIILINMSFVKTHYWKHYSVLFCPFITLMIVNVISAKNNNIKIFQTVLVIFFISIPLKSIIHNIKMINKNKYFELNINERNTTQPLVELTKNIRMNGYSFYFPFNVNYHRIVGEERIGDGHPVMLGYVISGKQIGPINGIDLYKYKFHSHPCDAFDESGKDFIIISENDYIENSVAAQCLESSKIYMNSCGSPPPSDQFVRNFCSNPDGVKIYQRRLL